MKKLFLIVGTIFVICIGFLYFYLFDTPSSPISTPSEVLTEVKDGLKDNYKVSTIKSITKTSTFEDENRQMKWLIINLDHQPITNEKEKLAIAEKVCKIILKFGYEGVDILPTTVIRGANCGIWGS